MQFLITDPCYIVPKDEWSKFVDDIYDNNWGFADGEKVLPYKINGLGKITELSNTANGDGACKVTVNGKGFTIGVDAGLVCIAQVSNTYKLPKSELGALTNNQEEAQRIFEQACRI